MERFIDVDAAREIMLLQLRENANLAANLFAEYKKALAENEELKATLSEVQKEIADVKALIDVETKVSDAALETYQRVQAEIVKFKALFEA
ncbi:hypothetical protein V6N13_062078 [Hibiscus sabdariffa]|uniref:Uncharacterized protein n=2 Tax=Hibiscus sabdariffa TaxID=183260 RepID=A0ABR2PFS4_9ROSI